MNAFPTPESVAANSVQPLAAAPAPTVAQPEIENLDQVIMQWRQATDKLAEIKKAEKDLRDQLTNCQLWNNEKTTGTQTHRLGFGWELKLVRTERVSVANENGEAAAVYMQMQSMGLASADRAARLFKFSASIKETVYKELTEAEKALVDPLLTRKPGSTTLKIKEPQPPKE